MTALIVGLIAFTVIVVIHEFGHYIIAKLSDIKVEEFAVGMGKKITSIKRGETEFSIRIFPLGGFCKMLGEDEDNPDPRSFNSKPVWKRIAVIFFGPFLNYVLAVLVFSLLFAQVTLIDSVMPNMPAEKAGIVKGDVIKAVNGVEITKWGQVNEIITKSEGKNVSVKLENKGNIREINVVPVKDKASNAVLMGIRIKAEGNINGFSLSQGIEQTTSFTVQIFDFLGQLFTGRVSFNDLAGPVGIIKIMGDAAKMGFIHVLLFTGYLSLNLAIMNLLPIPALDGGRLIFLVIEAIRRRPMNPEKEGFVHFVGFVLLMAMSVLVLFNDLIRLKILNF